MTNAQIMQDHNDVGVLDLLGDPIEAPESGVRYVGRPAQGAEARGAAQATPRPSLLGLVPFAIGLGLLVVQLSLLV
jgi:hypothetical protein